MANHTDTAEEEEEFSDQITNSLCSEAIDALQRILPHLEDGLAQLVASARSPTPDGTVASLVSRMCDLYRDILRGGFCPQAPHLLLHSTDRTFHFVVGNASVSLIQRVSHVALSLFSHPPDILTLSMLGLSVRIHQYDDDRR
jgi:hypothetical protein